MSSPNPSVTNLKAAFEQRSKPTTITVSRPPGTPANKMFPAKLSPVKASIDVVLDTARAPSRLWSKSPPPAAASPPTSAPATPPNPSSPATGPVSAPPSPVPIAADSTLPSQPPASAAPDPPAPIIAPTPVASSSPVGSDPPAAPQPIAFPLTRLTAALRPFWIGPPRVAAPPQAMKVTATVEYTSKGLQPPVYVFTSLSDPQWEPVEMEYEKQADGENRFHKTFQADEGEYQYKFRLGPGDWWALDEGVPTVDDGLGNKNNLMVVKPAAVAQPAPRLPKEEPAKAVDPPAPQQPAAPVQAPAMQNPAPSIPNPLPAIVDTVKTAISPTQSAADSMPSAAPLMAHEQPPPSEKLAPSTANPLPAVTETVKSAMAPLMKHEEVAPQHADLDENAYFDNEDEVFEHQQSPLLRHESFGPDADEQVHSPLMRHETMSIGEHLDEPDHTYALSHTSSGSVPEEADPNDASLEPFPTDHAGIFQHIHRASTQLPADEVHDEANASSPASAGGRKRSTSSVPSLPSVQEEEDEEEEDSLEKAHLHALHEVQDKELDPLADGVPAVMVTEPPAQRPAALITPPMTPQEAEKIVEHLVEEAEAKGIAEGIVLDEIAHANEQQKQEKVPRAKHVQQRSLFDGLSPMTILALAGIALAVVAGAWKLQ